MGEIIKKDIIMEKINIAELLKDCPKGMELDCTIFDDVHFDFIDDVCDIINCYIQDSTNKIGISFSKYGCYSSISKSKCVIFPKGKTTWEGFVPPVEFKDGDVVVAEDDESFQLFLLKHLIRSEDYKDHDGYCYFGWNFQCNELFEKGKWGFNRLATEEEKEKLFKAIKDSGYKWNAESKTLEKLKKEKFDLTTLVPFESRVLVRDTNTQTWEGAFYSHYDVKDTHPYHCILFGRFKQCIPFEGNEHLLGKTDDCDEYYKIWK